MMRLPPNRQRRFRGRPLIIAFPYIAILMCIACHFPPAAASDSLVSITQHVSSSCSFNGEPLAVHYDGAIVGTGSDSNTRVAVSCNQNSTIDFTLSWADGQDAGGGVWSFGDGRVQGWMCDQAGGNCCALGSPCREVLGPGGKSSIYLFIRYTPSRAGHFSHSGTLKLVHP